MIIKQIFLITKKMYDYQGHCSINGILLSYESPNLFLDNSFQECSFFSLRKIVFENVFLFSTQQFYRTSSSLIAMSFCPFPHLWWNNGYQILWRKLWNRSCKFFAPTWTLTTWTCPSDPENNFISCSNEHFPSWYLR